MLQTEIFFRTLTRALMTLLLCGSFCPVLLLVRMNESPDAALSLYHSLPEVTEHLLAGLLFYLIFALFYVKYVSSAQPSA